MSLTKILIKIKVKIEIFITIHFASILPAIHFYIYRDAMV